MNKVPAPSWLSKEAKKIWNRKIKEISSVVSDISKADLGVLAMYCENLAEYYKLAKLTAKN